MEAGRGRANFITGERGAGGRRSAGREVYLTEERKGREGKGREKK